MSLATEHLIVWLDDPAKYPYVREWQGYICGTRRRPPRWHGTGRIVGYSTLKPDAPSSGGTFTRRVFWVAEYDRSEQPNGIYRTGAPCEAVDPATIRPGALGKMTDRAWGQRQLTRSDKP